MAEELQPLQVQSRLISEGRLKLSVTHGEEEERAAVVLAVRAPAAPDAQGAARHRWLGHTVMVRPRDAADIQSPVPRYQA